MKIVVYCEKCGYEPPEDQGSGFVNWKTMNKKRCAKCGTKLKVVLVKEVV